MAKVFHPHSNQQRLTAHRPFLADDQPHSLPPALEAVAGDLGDPGPAPDVAAGLERCRTGRNEDLEYSPVNLLGAGHADRVRQPPSALPLPRPSFLPPLPGRHTVLKHLVDGRCPNYRRLPPTLLLGLSTTARPTHRPRAAPVEPVRKGTSARLRRIRRQAEQVQPLNTGTGPDDAKDPAAPRSPGPVLRSQPTRPRTTPTSSDCTSSPNGCTATRPDLLTGPAPACDFER